MGRPKGYPKTGGRKKGTQNLIPQELKTMILASLDRAGGIEYLTNCAKANPGPYLGLIGKVLPMQLNASMSMRVVLDDADRDL
ncbi:MAG TPA: hypothetical protein PLD10_07190 [Rhodopila sp.]|nr:hypothetical protein [Rhodopila sp.]